MYYINHLAEFQCEVNIQGHQWILLSWEEIHISVWVPDYILYAIKFLGENRFFTDTSFTAWPLRELIFSLSFSLQCSNLRCSSQNFCSYDPIFLYCTFFSHKVPMSLPIKYHFVSWRDICDRGREETTSVSIWHHEKICVGEEDLGGQVLDRRSSD